MSTLILDKVLSGYNLAKVNDNFERIEKAFNEALLHRDGSKELTDDLDVNSQKLLNVGGIEIGGVDIATSISQLQEEWQALFQGIEEYKAAADEILKEAISYGAVDQKNIGNAQRVFTTSSNYATNSNLILPLPYIVGKNTLKLNLGHYYDMFNGVDYEEVGTAGSTSTTIKLLRPISSGAEIEEFVDGSSDLYSIYSTAEALQTLLTTSYSPESISAFVDSVSDIEELGLEDKIEQLNTQYEQLVAYSTALQTTVADINTKYSTITDMYEDMGTKYSLLETLYPQLLALISDTNFDLDDLNSAIGDLNDAIEDINEAMEDVQGYAESASDDATAAASSASNASDSATAAAGSASSAAGALTNAKIWAEGTDGQVETLGGVHSSKGWAEQAETIASAVKYVSQSLTDAQKAQARENIKAGSAKPFLIVVAGQSNAVGSAEASSSIVERGGKFWNGNTNSWVSGIADPVYPSSTGGFVPSLCSEITKKTGRPVYIINTAVGGSVCCEGNPNWMDKSWSVNGDLRPRAEQMVSTAISALGNTDFEMVGTVWLQGETDAVCIKNSQEDLSDYATCIDNTISWAKTAFGGDFFCIPIAYRTDTTLDGYVESVNNALLSSARTHDSIIVGADFTLHARENGYLRTDEDAHYKIAGYDILGGLIADGVIGSSCSIVPKRALSIRKLGDILGDTVNVKDYGATGDGTTDDTKAIQSAIDSNYNRTIFFPDGIYLVSDTIITDCDMAKRQSLLLSSGARIKASSTFSGDYVVNLGGRGTAPAYMGSDIPVGIEGGLIDGNSVANGLKSIKTHCARIQNINIWNITNVGLYVGNSNNTSADAYVQNISVSGENAVGSIGIWIDSNDCDVRDIRVRGCQIGIKMLGGYLQNAHPIFGGVSQSVWEASIGFYINSTHMVQCYADNFGTAFYINSTGHWEGSQLTALWYENTNYKRAVFSIDGYWRGNIDGLSVTFPSNGTNQGIVNRSFAISQFPYSWSDSSTETIRSLIGEGSWEKFTDRYSDPLFLLPINGRTAVYSGNTGTSWQTGVWYPLIISQGVDSKIDVRCDFGNQLTFDIRYKVSGSGLVVDAVDVINNPDDVSMAFCATYRQSISDVNAYILWFKITSANALTGIISVNLNKPSLQAQIFSHARGVQSFSSRTGNAYDISFAGLATPEGTAVSGSYTISGQLPTVEYVVGKSISASKSAIKYSSGRMAAWGKVSYNSSNIAVTFPYEFIEAPAIALGSNVLTNLRYTGLSTTGMNLQAGAAASISWVAEGMWK